MPLPDEPSQPRKDDLRPYLSEGLQNIALSFSGGGFRAAGFSLGCFSFLGTVDHTDSKLSEKVRFISSASGGSFASMIIVCGQRLGWPFKDCYRRLFECMEGDKLLQSVIGILEDDAVWDDERPNKDRNPINAFAVAYDKYLFSGETFGVLWQPVQKGAVPEICVNATDFTHGQQFRFQHDGSGHYRGEVGNNFLSIKKYQGKDSRQVMDRRWNVLKKIKLGDILAASSCFPGGFEPILLPNDFAWRNASDALTVDDLREAIAADNSFVIPNPGMKQKPGAELYGLMDGGIVDNQGIDAFSFAERRLKTRQLQRIEERLGRELKVALDKAKTETQKELLKKEYEAKRQSAEGYGYDLLAICDVSSNYTEAFSYERPVLKHWLLRPSFFHYTLLAVMVFALGLAGICSQRYLPLAWMAVGATAVPMSVLCSFLFPKFLTWLTDFFRGPEEAKPSASRMFRKHFWYFFKLPLSRLMSLAEMRASSLVYLSVTLFLKKIRQNAYADHLSSSLSKGRLRMLMTKAEQEKLVFVTDELGLARLVADQKSWNHNTINPTIYLLSTRHRNKLQTEISKENWTKVRGHVSPDLTAAQLQTLLEPSELVTKVADLAASMPTTLWFDATHQAKDMRAALIACGQFTMCHAILRFVHRFANADEDWQALRKQLLADWHRFQHNPYWLYNQTGAGYVASGKPLAGFSPVGKV